MASRDKVDVDMFHKSIQYALEILGKSKSGFERTVLSKLKEKDARALGTSLLIIPELRVLVLTKRHVGSWNEIGLLSDRALTHCSTKRLCPVPQFLHALWCHWYSWQGL